MSILTRVIAAAWLRVIGGDPAFQGDPGLLLEILEIQAALQKNLRTGRG